MKLPKHCQQNWLDMSISPDGRLCQKCSKNIYDFSKMNWHEIQNLQKENKNSLCGMYSEKQLKYWGKQPPASKPIKSSIAATSLILGLGSIIPNKAISQTKENTTQIQKSIEKTDSIVIKNKNNIIIKGQVFDYIDEKINEPIPFVLIQFKNLKYSVLTDFDGNFSFELNENLTTIKNDILICHYLGDSTEYPLNNYLYNNPPIIIKFDTYRGINVFYVKKPTLWRKIKWNIKNSFRRKNND